MGPVLAHRDQSLRYNSLVATGAQRTSGCACVAKAQSRLTHTGSRGLFDELVVAAREQCDLPSLPNATQQIPARPLAF
jgi:hypothetical protein